MSLEFAVSDEDEKKVKAWFEKHKCHEPSKQAKLRSLVYSFFNNGVGVVSKAKCTGCGKVIDFTDVKSW